MNWYCFEQNNSGGSFVVDDKVCNSLFIEAESFDDAVKKAKRISVGKYEPDATRRYEYARRILMPLIMSL